MCHPTLLRDRRLPLAPAVCGTRPQRAPDRPAVGPLPHPALCPGSGTIPAQCFRSPRMVTRHDLPLTQCSLQPHAHSLLPPHGCVIGAEPPVWGRCRMASCPIGHTRREPGGGWPAMRQSCVRVTNVLGYKGLQEPPWACSPAPGATNPTPHNQPTLPTHYQP